MRRLAAELRSVGYTVTLASNCDEENGDQYARKHYLDDFDECFMSYDMGLLKPSEEFFQRVLEILGAQAYECCFIDDHRTNVSVASHLGFRSLQVDSGLDGSGRTETVREYLRNTHIYSGERE